MATLRRWTAGWGRLCGVVGLGCLLVGEGCARVSPPAPAPAAVAGRVPQDQKTEGGAAETGQEKAVRLRRLAEAGDPTAQNNLGVLYDDGAGVPVDHDEATRLFRAAAAQGMPSAMANLG